MRELIDGSTAIVRGALDAGCDFFAGSPITPATPVLTAMSRELPKLGGVAVQGEDEIASIGFCLGAALAGARAMTATSGPGMSLMSESLGLAIMGEVPLVVVDVQRLGPATGGATTGAQGDVQFVRWGMAGGCPLIVLAPSTVPECYELTLEAFDLAERFRVPVVLLTDKDLHLTRRAVEAGIFGHSAVRRERAGSAGERAPYRYEPADGVPPMRRYGTSPLRFTGSAHDENAIITKDPQKIDALERHLAAKIEAHRDEIERTTADLDAGATTLLVAYGSTAGAVRAAARRWREGGGPVSTLIIQSLWPVPETALAAALDGVSRVVVAELNLGLYRREIERLAGEREVVGVHRVDGLPITPSEILEVIR